jgi:hypothetical protein
LNEGLLIGARVCARGHETGEVRRQPRRTVSLRRRSLTLTDLGVSFFPKPPTPTDDEATNIMILTMATTMATMIDNDKRLFTVQSESCRLCHVSD